MIRFIIKSAFFLGLAAMVLSALGIGTTVSRPADATSSFDMFATIAGAQAAIADVSSFCDRAPTACAAGEQLASFAAERVGDGLALAYGAFYEGSGSRDSDIARVRAAPRASPPLHDRMMTGAVRAVETAPRVSQRPMAHSTFSMPALGTTRARPIDPQPPVALLPTAVPVPRSAPRA